MDPKKLAAAIKKFRLALAKWLRTAKSGDGEIDSSLDFIATALRDISGSNMFGDSWDNTSEGLDEIRHELGVVAKAFSKIPRSSGKTNKARQFERVAEALISELENSDLLGNAY